MRSIVLALSLLVLAGCGGDGPGQNLLGMPGLAAAIREYYDRRAWERDATCLAPRMGSITRADFVEQAGDESIVRIRYAWDAQTFGDRRFSQGCVGFADRDFHIRFSGIRPVVLGMTGEQRVN